MDRDVGWINPQDRGVSRIMAKRDTRGGLPMYLNSTHFPKFSICIWTFQFMIECSEIQSLNGCKRVGVSGHIPKLLDTLGSLQSTLGKCVSEASKPKERKFVWVTTTIYTHSLCAWGASREKERELGAGVAMEGEF